MGRHKVVASFLTTGITVLVVVLGCITVNINFPEKELQEAAEDIVDDVRPEIASSGSASEDGTVEDGDVSAPADGDESAAIRRCGGFHWAALFRVPTAVAQAAAPEETKKKVRINVSTPRIKAIKATLTKRYVKLYTFYRTNVVGETNTGYLAIRDTKGLSLKANRDLKLLAKAENKDRKALYTEIAAQNSIEKSRIPQIGKLFSVEWQKKCKTGWWIQDKKGKWLKKKPPKKKPPKKST